MAGRWRRLLGLGVVSGGYGNWAAGAFCDLSFGLRRITDVVECSGVFEARRRAAENAQVVVNGPHERQPPKEFREQTGFVVWFGVNDVRAAFDKARRASAAVSDFYGDYFFARDPDGRYIGIYALEDHAHGHDNEN